jgi:hypothetical protein
MLCNSVKWKRGRGNVHVNLQGPDPTVICILNFTQITGMMNQYFTYVISIDFSAMEG